MTSISTLDVSRGLPLTLSLRPQADSRIVNKKQIPQKDHLSNLPPELLTQIFRDISTPIIEGLSRSLLTYTRSTLYQKIRIMEIKKVKRFMRTVANSPSIGSQIVVLSIELGVVYSASKDELSVQEAMQFLGNLNRVKVMTLNFTWLTTIMSSLSVATSSLPLLKDLTITTPPFPHRIDYWETESFKRFNFYPSLGTLRLHTYFSYHGSQVTTQRNKWIDINGNVDDEIARIENSGGREVQITKELEVEKLRRDHRIKELYVEGRSVDYQLIMMIFKLAGLKKLSITDEHHGPYVLDVLENVSNPSRLKSLKLDIKWQLHRLPALNIQPQLVKFNNLTVLKLSAHLFQPEIFKFLRDPLPLTLLSLGRGTEVIIKELRSLILPGSNKLSSLKTLRLDVVGGKISKDRVEEIGEAYYGRHNQDPARPYPGWKVPAWKEGTFDEKGLIDLIKLANDAGIEVIGSSVKAIGIYEAYVEECEIADEYDEERCTEEGDSDCTDCFESDDWDEESF